MKRPSLVDAVEKSGRNRSTLDDFSRAPEATSEHKVLFVRVSPSLKKQLKLLAVELDRSEQDLMTEAANDLLIKYGRKPR